MLARMANPTPRVFTIPASAPFIPTLVRALISGGLVPGFAAGPDPLALAAATIYLPTRRACRLARDLFLDVTGASAAILPRFVPIGDPDEDEIVFAQAASPGEAALDLPEAMGGLPRRLLLAQLVAAWVASPEMRGEGRAPLVANNPTAALALADDLARLMDDMTTREVSWDKLDGLVPDNLDEYWQFTLKFVNFVRRAWPTLLAENGVIEPAARRDALIKAETERLAQAGGPVIVAGSTGSMPATAALIATVAKLAHGAVVLPGLDTDLDAGSWDLIAGSTDASGRETMAPAIGHPQFAMQALLTRIGIARDDVQRLAEPGPRERYVSEAMRPAAATDQWQQLATTEFRAQVASALNDFSVIEAANPEEEALAIAVALRQAIETPGKTAALVTPDRGLARRVLAALARWNVPVDDSGGDALSDTPAGRFARLAAEAALGGLAPVTLLALLKHPLLRLGAGEGAHTHAIATLERAVLRGPRPRRGTAGLADALATFRAELGKFRRKERCDLHPSDPRVALTDNELQAAADLVVELIAALVPLEGLRAGAHALADLVARHQRVIALLVDDGAGAPAVPAGADGKALAEMFDEIVTHAPAGGQHVAISDYPDLFRSLSDRVVRRPGGPGARVRIYGPLEARLQTIDRVVLGGLIEGTWPPETRSDPWLSRPMRHALGLDLPERRISLSAHDFAQMLGAREVILTRAAKSAGAPTVASRFLQRLAAVAGAQWQAVCANGEGYLAWARDLDASAQPPQPAKRPEPTPPVEARPTRLSVTEIEHWLRDPYTIYAKHILRLTPLDAVDTPPGAGDRGTVIHGAIGEFTQQFAQTLPPDPLAALLALGRKHFAALEDYPEAKAFWWPRFERIARWFAAWEVERRAGLAAVHAETRGEIEIPLGARSLRLSARADRIERLSDGRYAILDYKTGQTPTAPQVASGLAPQLTLEAAILRAGKFPGIVAEASVAALVYVAIKGGEPAGDNKVMSWKDSTPDAEADKALAALTKVAKRFEELATPYRSRERPMFQRRAYGAYDHLARVKEWTLFGEADDDMGGGE
jgi:ATP-dependent helicase/nuclease subunit B